MGDAFVLVPHRIDGQIVPEPPTVLAPIANDEGDALTLNERGRNARNSRRIGFRSLQIAAVPPNDLVGAVSRDPLERLIAIRDRVVALGIGDSDSDRRGCDRPIGKVQFLPRPKHIAIAFADRLKTEHHGPKNQTAQDVREHQRRPVGIEDLQSGFKPSVNEEGG